MNKEQSIKALQVSAILFKYNVPIAEAKFIGSFIEELIQESQKQKEVIDKLNKLIAENSEKYWIDDEGEPKYLFNEIRDILSEVE